MDEIIKVLRSLAISKNGNISLQELVRDFKENEGYWVEPKKYGFKDIKDFLVASNQFTFRYSGITVFFVDSIFIKRNQKYFFLDFSQCKAN